MLKLYIIYIFLGIIKGIIGTLPLSSSGHYLLLINIFNFSWLNNINFFYFSNVAIVLAIFVIYRKSLINLVESLFIFIIKPKRRKEKSNDCKYLLLLIITFIPSIITRIILDNKIINTFIPTFLAICFFLDSLSLFIVRNIKGYKKDKDITFKDAMFIGLLQSISIIPGISIIGITLTCCLLRGLEQNTAIRYTFLSYSLVILTKSFNININSISFYYILGLITAFMVTILSYNYLCNIVKKGNLLKLSLYSFIIGLFILFYFRN